MASEWFYARDGQKHGPYSSPQLRAMAQSGELLRTDLIWKEGMADWRPAGETTQLFAGVRESGKTQSKAKAAVAESGGAGATVPQPKGLKATAQAAARAAQLAAERTKLTTVSLPAAYLELGKHCYDSRAFASEFPKEMSELDQLEARLSAEAESTAPTSASSWSDRAKAMGGKGLDFAQKQKAAFEKAAALKRLGKLAYEQRGSSTGPDSLVGPVTSALSRIAEIDSVLTASPLKRRRWRLWHVAAAVMGLSLVAGAVKELMTDKQTPSVPSASNSGEQPSQLRVQATATEHKPSESRAKTRAPLSVVPKDVLVGVLSKYEAKGGLKLYAPPGDAQRVLALKCNGLRGSDLEWLPNFPTITHAALILANGSSLEYLFALPALRFLDLSGVRLSPTDLDRLATSAPNIDTLVFQATKESGDVYLDRLSRFPHLRVLSISGLPSLSDRRFATCPSIEVLQLYDARQEHVNACEGHPNLRVLRLDNVYYSQRATLPGNKVHGVGSFEPLQSCPRLESLASRGKKDLGDDAASIVDTILPLRQLIDLLLDVSSDKARVKLQTERAGLFKGDAQDKKSPRWMAFEPSYDRPVKEVRYSDGKGIYFD